ncbi:hypothetical protein EYB45_07590 [Erythrobacteraceae bacterium CFH 75059]|uniref:hypothetical protein n=1 Tax=Qipengyuania thermophila TaxID=2509361 RepID=UPI00101F87AD|nr:hypothetical protein [Qipengyuania thermophila]TCD05332.1 hypothetical protein EYB45_07590 [Erythrobacteraceae bacterium CFH 75059]
MPDTKPPSHDALHADQIEWDDRASLHLAEGSKGLLTDLTAVRRGTFAELVAQVMVLPPEEQKRYAILKSGDQRFDAEQIAAVSRRPDFPSRL